MSDLPPEPPPIELSYETPQPSQNAPLLVKLSGIFLLSSAGLDFLYVAYNIATIGFLYWRTGSFNMFPAGPGVPPGFGIWMSLAQLVPPVLSLIEAILKVVAGTMLLHTSRYRMGRYRWGWGLAAGIAACLDLWSCPCCLLSLATGIYTIVILCLPQVRAFLASPRQ